MWLLTAAQLVSESQVAAARNKAIMWTVFAVVMAIITTVKIVRMVRKKQDRSERDHNQP